MATTTNYNWTTPDDTSLVKDGAAAIRTLGSSIDTTTKNLNPQTTTGAIAYRSATSNVNTSLPIGTAGQVLTVNSGATAPEWANISAGGMTLLSTTTMSGVTTTVSSISGSYTDLFIEIFGAVGTGGSADQNMKFFMNGTSSGKSFGKGISSGGGEATAAFNTGMFLDYNTTTNVSISGGNNAFYVMIRDYANTSNAKSYFSYGNYNGNVVGFITGSAFSTSAITSIGAGFSTASATAGTIKVWGIK